MAAEKTAGSTRAGTHGAPTADSKEGPWVAKTRDRTRIPVCTVHLAQARHVDTSPLLNQARLATILRANPYPEVTDRICRLPLSTLFYRLEAIDLGDLLRIWVRAGAVFLVALSRIFKVRGDDSDTAVSAVLFAFQTLSPC